MKRLIFIFMALCIATSIYAQTDDESAWGMTHPGFTQKDPWPNPWFSIAYGESPTLDGQPLDIGVLIEAYVGNIMCGVDTVRWARDGSRVIVYGFMPIYGDDPYEPGVQGAVEGDTVKFVVDNKKTKQFFVWGVQDENGQFAGIYNIPNFTTACPLSADGTGDGLVDISDFVCLVDYLMFNNNYMKCPIDPNCDGTVDIADLMYLGDYLFLYGVEPKTCGKE